MKTIEREKDKYTIANLVDKAIELFILEDSNNTRDAYRKKIDSVSKEFRNGHPTDSLFTQTEIFIAKETNKEVELSEKEKKELRADSDKRKKENITIRHLFTKEQMSALFCHPPLYDYFKNRSSSEKIKNGISLQDLENEAQTRNKTYENFLLENNLIAYADTPAPPVTENEYSNKVIEIMLNALFERYFEPLNKEMLSNDMNIIRNSYGNETIESLMAEKRLQNGRNYYSEKRESALEFVKQHLDMEDENSGKNGSYDDREILDYIGKNCSVYNNLTKEDVYKYIKEFYKNYYINKLKKYLEEYYDEKEPSATKDFINIR